MIAKKALLAGCLALSAASLACANVLVSDFEPAHIQDGMGINGWFGYGGNPVAAATVGGANAMQITINGQYWGQVTCQYWANSALSAANYNANTQIEFDVLLPSSGFNWPALQAYAQVGANATLFQTPTVNVDVSTKDQWQHVTLDLSGMSTRTSNDDLMIYLNPGWGTGGTYTSQIAYIDNVQLSTVPEPATLGLIGTGALTLLARRRGRKA